MSELGQKLPLQPRSPTSALPPKADITRTWRHVRKVPITDISLGGIRGGSNLHTSGRAGLRALVQEGAIPSSGGCRQ